MSSQIAHRWLSRYAFAAQVLGIPALAGIAYLFVENAPASYAIVNSAALAVGLLVAIFAPELRSLGFRRGFAAFLLAALAVPLIFGPSVEGVSRWIALGDFTIHAGMLAIPPLVVLAARDRKAAPVIILAATLLAFAQPDSASCLALCLAALVQGAWQRSSLILGLGVLAAFGAIGASFNGALSPQPFVEGILPELWPAAPVRTVGLAIALSVPVVTLAWSYWRRSSEGWVLAACLTGFIAAAFLGDYPTPLIGYGAAPILGMGLALAALRRAVPDQAEPPLLITDESA